MPIANRSRYHPEVGGASYYYIGEDFRAWRAQFDALYEHERWPDRTARRYANACMRDSTHDAVRDITLAGPRSCSMMLDAYEERFQLLDDLVRIRMREEGLLRAPRHRRRPGEKRRGLRKPRAKRGIMTRMTRPLAPWNAGSMIRMEVSRGQWEDISLPSTSEEVRREIFYSRGRSLLRGRPQPSAEDLQNLVRLPPEPLSPGPSEGDSDAGDEQNLIRMPPQPLSPESPVSDTPPHLRAGPSHRSDEPDFQSGQ